MYAIIETGGKQYRVAKGDRIETEKLSQQEGEAVLFDKVLVVGGDDRIQIGRPYLNQAKVSGEVIEQGRGPKIVVYKYKRRKGYDKKQGHRQSLTTVEIKEISGGVE